MTKCRDCRAELRLGGGGCWLGSRATSRLLKGGEGGRRPRLPAAHLTKTAVPSTPLLWSCFTNSFTASIREPPARRQCEAGYQTCPAPPHTHPPERTNTPGRTHTRAGLLGLSWTRGPMPCQAASQSYCQTVTPLLPDTRRRERVSGYVGAKCCTLLMPGLVLHRNKDKFLTQQKTPPHPQFDSPTQSSYPGSQRQGEGCSRATAHAANAAARHSSSCEAQVAAPSSFQDKPLRPLAGILRVFQVPQMLK